jgi:hypothetical protein
MGRQGVTLSREGHHHRMQDTFSAVSPRDLFARIRAGVGFAGATIRSIRATGGSLWEGEHRHVKVSIDPRLRVVTEGVPTASEWIATAAGGLSSYELTRLRHAAECDSAATSQHS